MPHCSVKHTRGEALKAKRLVLNKLSLQDTLAIESKETLNQIKNNNNQTNKQIKTTTTATKLSKKQKTRKNERQRKEAFKSGGSM